MAPVKYRGALNILFQLNVTIGILFANIINYFVANIHPQGWRIALGIAGIPATLLFVGSLLITETPTSLIERQKLTEGLNTLKKIRGIDNVTAEYEELVLASEMARQVKHPYRNLMKRKSRPQLVIAIVMQVFQQFTGINAIMFYAPVLFQTVGLSSDASLMSSAIVGTINVLSTIVSVVGVDRVGRRVLLLEACVQMLVTQVHNSKCINTYTTTIYHKKRFFLTQINFFPPDHHSNHFVHIDLHWCCPHKIFERHR